MRASKNVSPPPTDRQRFDTVFEGLVSNRVAYVFSLAGSTGVREDRYNDYLRVAENCRTDQWVGEHVGNTDTGGGYWGEDGVLYGGHRPSTAYPVRQLWWSFNEDYPKLAALLVDLFRQQGIDAWWSGDPWDCVIVNLETPRGPVLPATMPGTQLTPAAS